MPAAQTAGMLTYGIQVVLRGPSRFGIQRTRRQVQILDGKRYSIIQLLAVHEVRVLGVLEPLEMQDQYLGGRPQIQLLVGPLVLFTLAAVPHLRLAQLFFLREFPETIHEINIPMTVFSTRSMLLDLIALIFVITLVALELER